jgi:DNA adenine methylase
MGFGFDGFNRNVRTGFRAASNRSWVNLPASLRAIAERFQGVVIENRAALDVIEQHDGDDTLHYLDPPYMPATRSDKSRKSGGAYHAYIHEMTDADHAEMLTRARDVKGAVVISGYPTSSYDAALEGWHRVSCEALADGALKRTEVLWINPRGLERMERLI